MPAFVIVESRHRRAGQPLDAIMYDPTVAGYPDKKTATPVKVIIAEKALKIDNEPRARSIISTIGENVKVTYCVDGSTKRLRNAEQRRQPAQISAQLDRLRDRLLLFKDQSENPSLVVEGLGLLYE
jgi:hypothetical protein